MQVEPPIAFVSHVHEPPGMEVRINFGVFAGREATPAEIDDLAEKLLAEVPEVSIVAENRHELGRHSEASLHQVRIELAHAVVPGDYGELDHLERQLLTTAERWTRACAAERHLEAPELEN
jgi:hypothetical protein